MEIGDIRRSMGDATDFFMKCFQIETIYVSSDKRTLSWYENSSSIKNAKL